MIADVVYINGEFFPKEDAKISVFDHNFVYGDGVFEGLQVVNGGIFRLDAHIERLYRSARFLAINIPMTPQEMTAAILETGRRNRLRDGYMRPMISRGSGPTGIRNMDQLGPPTVVIIAQHEKGKKHPPNGSKAHVTSVRRIPPECIDQRVKSCNYINNILAYLEAKNAGADTAIMLDIHGYVAEGYGNNIFYVDKGAVGTPLTGSILAGITRAKLIEICKKIGMPVSERPVTVYDLVTADEVFESSTLGEVSSITSIDGRQVADGRIGPITQMLHQHLRAEIESGTESTSIFND